MKELKKNIESEKVLKKLTESPDLSGGTTIPCGELAVVITAAFCPTSKCTTRCGSRG
ncbi:class II lanthipeptide, LchA2/BrtA2 family [Bacillus sp. FSL K6-0273]|uniref:class II lanthipeptide, LchA2/BrtA2 family n=1 Tax=Bacillus TaxID=1386 RepID=UPI0015965270|nr:MULTISPECIES: class II lanthipeptide, LchA2/BrtA2 family [Bacillus cereus group]MDF9468708.1 class II lanthipeptide, LchA2/BrtA2 family [Bacillus cereus]